ncbi:hypothetical protein O181_042089 [Austropuccinia psidii MF-1]|uniref:Uncharacterized protein n=1 Tax=Austropuccinia psidii MF-1 TaxID=1389203 RepID=A0A9Q3HH49_9BASI|nr:hypothetical protein [Austropuccinia psidii MF-1]
MSQFSTSPTPRPLSLFWGLGGLFSLPGTYVPWPNPLYYEGYGLNGLLGYLGPLLPLQPTVHTLRSVGPLEPFWPKSNEAKRGLGGSLSAPKSRWVPNHKWAHLSQFWPQTPTNSEMAKTPQDPKIGHNSVHGLWKPPEATRSAPSKDSLQVQGKFFPSSMHPTLKDPGVVHIWYNIQLCTILAQKSNGDAFRTKLCDSKSSPQSITNFEGGFFSYSVRKFPGSYQKTIQGPQPPGPAGVGLSILIRNILMAILRGYQLFQSLSRNQVLTIPWITELVHRGINQASCMALANLGQFIFHCGN